MRRALAALTALLVVTMVGGCTLIQGLVTTYGPESSQVSVEEDSCLDGLVGTDSDREAIVDCADPHLFEVTAIGSWPGMQDLIDEHDGDLGAAWDELQGPEGDADYVAWASRFCNEGAQRRVGIDGVVVDGHTAADLWLRVGGTYGVDFSLASREDFVGRADSATVCSLAWYDGDTPRLLASPPFEQLRYPGFDLDMRECWGPDLRATSCADPHVAQVLFSFQGLEAFGADVIGRLAAGTATDVDWAAVDDVCTAIIPQALPTSADFGELGSLADLAASEAWDDFDGSVDPDGAYWFSCLAIPLTDDTFTGDVFDGTAAIT